MTTTAVSPGTRPVASPLVSRHDGVAASQLEFLDDTDCYATAWQEALLHSDGRWGGRGRGGRALARRTRQPRDVVVSDVCLAYVGTAAGPCSLLLENALLKLLSPHVYALVGRNGSGKSSLLRRIHAGRVPGFPRHVNVLLVSQEIACDSQTLTPVEYVLQVYRDHVQSTQAATELEIQELEQMIEALDIDSEEDQQKIEELSEKLSSLEDEHLSDTESALRQKVEDALEFMAVPSKWWNAPIASLSPGLQRKTMLSVALICPCNLLLLDEPTNHLDIAGLLQLRRLIQLVTAACNESGHPATVLLTSHDLDLINDVATDIIELSQAQLFYSPGNYVDYRVYKQQNDLHALRQMAALDRRRDAMAKTLDNLERQAVRQRGGAQKIGRQIEARRKKMEKEGINADAKGHRWTAQNAGTGIKVGSINAMDASTRRGKTTQELLKLAEKSLRPPPDKAVQFVFRNPSSQWGEPLIRAINVGHGYNLPVADQIIPSKEYDVLRARDGFLFDSLELCVEERGRYCILGENSSGKSTLLRILAKLEEPLEGSVHHALNVDVGYMDERVVDRLVRSVDDNESSLAYLSRLYPKKTEQELRAELAAFGLSPRQSTTSIQFLSGGERRRLSLASLMLRDPQVLILDQPTSDLDMESVEALLYGLRNWTGTLMVATHDTNFLRSLEVDCYALVQGRLRHVVGGVDEYIRSFVQQDQER